jgi:hypothetical protein
MKNTLKLAILALAAVPMMASAQVYYLHIPSAQDHYDIDGIGGGGPFNVDVYDSTNTTLLGSQSMFCDSLSEEFSLGSSFKVLFTAFNNPTPTSLDPWVITNANAQAMNYDTLHSVSLTTKQINSAIQGVIWTLDGQISGTMTSGDADTAGFANYLLGQANSIGTTNVLGYGVFDSAPFFNDNNGNGQPQIGMNPVPEPISMSLLGLGAFAALRRRK